MKKKRINYGKIFGDELVAIHHIGSTSIQGMLAKPIIDIMPVVRDIAKMDCFTDDMAKVGYIAKGENGIARRRYFQKGGDHRTHHVHVFQENDPNIIEHLAFRDYLRMHPDWVRKYGELKAELAQQFPYDIASYIDGKDEWIQQRKQEALRWCGIKINN
ncbi:GrpB family protein [Brevibacillus dissolubilis]|uniref:GrpB family protein n=1 Tax=Brevibacillus dissolubilis TaxID=1844116 RepID=UPI0034CDC9DA